MKTHELAGELTSALAHFAAVGLAAILVDSELHSGSGDASAKTWWSDVIPARPLLSTTLDEVAVGEVVRLHAARHTHADSWVQARVREGSRAGSGLFSPRLKSGPLSEIATFDAERQAALAASEARGAMSELDWRMLGALGEPAWWRCAEKESTPDSGASRWEMKTRNRGEEFVLNRLSPLAECVARRSAEEVWSGLSGRTVTDELGRGPSSRTSTGLTPPGPADSAVAWCALWGLSVLSIAHVSASEGRERGMSQSPGTWPRNRVHPVLACLPAYTSPVSSARVRSVMSSARFDVAAFGDVRQLGEDVLGARTWLSQQGVRALVKFRIHKGGSDSAPERWLLGGEVIPL